ncbi:trehalose-phosphatase [Flexivirga caeni]|uniref:trehalose-phosphatase n=1 Tax=Flexivirga caeni TaxID=2294115 RepID=UPI00131585E9|nr:trehalose-phosphatase [Flexivirga caeni]
MPAELHGALSRFAAHERVLVATDFDGVLAPLVQDPSTSRPVDGSMQLLHEIAAMPGVFAAVVSGRHLDALGALTGVGAADPIVLVGSHGAEADRELPLEASLDAEAQGRLARAETAVEQIVATYPSTRIERKPANVVLHTRGVAPDIARAATEAALAIDIPGVDVMRGKQMVEFSALPVTKGDALRALAAEFGSAATLYFGDDVTDERAFAVLAGDAQHVTVKVGPGDTSARFRVDDPADVVAVLQRVHDLREDGFSRRPPTR